MKQAFVTFLSSDGFLPGVITLNRSLKRFGNTNFPLVIMVSEGVSDEVIKTLKVENVNLRVVKAIKSPYRLQYDFRNFQSTFTKLRIFGLTEFDKVVYLDADLLVCENIELLFDKPNMSAVIAGGILPTNKSWKDLNSGLLIVEPNAHLFYKMLEALNFLPSKDGSDQGFLHQFFRNWKNNEKLHLEHKYNVPSWFLDEYCTTSDFQFNFKDGIFSKKNISVIHFWGLPKPWQVNTDHIELKSKKGQAVSLWKSIYEEKQIS